MQIIESTPERWNPMRINVDMPMLNLELIPKNEILYSSIKNFAQYLMLHDKPYITPGTYFMNLKAGELTQLVHMLVNTQNGDISSTVNLMVLYSILSRAEGCTDLPQNEKDIDFSSLIFLIMLQNVCHLYNIVPNFSSYSLYDTNGIVFRGKDTTLGALKAAYDLGAYEELKAAVRRIYAINEDEE